MAFNSYEFLLFLPLVFALYFILPKKVRHIELLIASYVFYGFYNPKLLALILFTTLCAYVFAIVLNKTEKRWLRTLFFVSSIVLITGVLIYFKYFNFIFETIAGVFRFEYNALDIILPVGISFYTFQTLSYVIDVYRKKIEPEKNILYFALYVSFFPQLVAGPIERPDNLIPQLKKKDGINIDNLKIGLKYILSGYVKKICIADMISVFVNPIFNDIQNANGLLVFIGSIFFAIQIYGDFAGYSDIAIGTAKLFNIDLMKNFDEPYRSASIKEFWNRWHISLSKWLRDYIYYPMGGSRTNEFRWVINTIVVFFISGLWHGAAFTFIIWGLLHALFKIIGKYTLKIRNTAYTKIKLNVEGKAVKVIRTIITFLLVCFAWIAFRSNSIAEMFEAYAKLFTDWSLTQSYFANVSSILNLNLSSVIVIVSIVVLLIFVSILNTKRFSDSKELSIARKTSYIILSWCVIVCFIYLKTQNLDSSFIYFRF